MKVVFCAQTPYGLFSDALNLPDDQSFTEEQIQAMQQQRIDQWITFIETSATEVPVEQPTDQPLDLTVETTTEQPTDSAELPV